MNTRNLVNTFAVVVYLVLVCHHSVALRLLRDHYRFYVDIQQHSLAFKGTHLQLLTVSYQLSAMKPKFMKQLMTKMVDTIGRWKNSPAYVS